jgi:PAS domain S-box-containing protein
LIVIVVPDADEDACAGADAFVVGEPELQPPAIPTLTTYRGVSPALPQFRDHSHCACKRRTLRLDRPHSNGLGVYGLESRMRGDRPDLISASTEQLLDSAPDGVVIIDADGVIRLVNRQAEALFGYAREELLGQPVELLVPDSVRPAHPGHRRGYFRDPTTRPMGAGLELTARRKDGIEFPVDISLSSLETDGGLLVSAAVRDISERKKIEAKFQGLLEAAPDAIVAVDLNGLIHLVNRQAEALFGYPREELIGTTIDNLVPDRIRAVHPDHRASYFASPTARPMGAGLTLAARRKDGTEFPVDISLSSLDTEDGVLVSAAVRDVTDRTRIEEERAQLEVRLLEAKQQEERATLEAQLHQAQRLESIGQLAGGIAHDFNNLLAGIMNYAGLVAAGLQEETARHGLSEEEGFVTIAQDVDEITSVAKRAAALTHQLLIFSRREVVQPEVLDLNAIVGEMEKLLRRTIGETVELSTVFASDLPPIKADRGQIEQVFMNLAVNARDAMAGGGKLEIATATFEVDEEYSRLHNVNVGTYARLTVSDTGTGMSEEVAARAFEPFFTTKPKGEGSGLGLATVYGIATQAGGDVVIYSEPGLGTTIRVNLPATSEAKSPARAGAPDALLAAKGETVLLVEDEEIVREPARRMLGKHGYAVLAAANAEDALVIVREHSGDIDLLLTDVVMPGRSGKELSIEVAALRPSTKVLFMSGYSHDVIVHQGVLEEGVHLIEKPFSAEGLLRKVREVLNGGPS